MNCPKCRYETKEDALFLTPKDLYAESNIKRSREEEVFS